MWLLSGVYLGALFTDWFIEVVLCYAFAVVVVATLTLFLRSFFVKH